MDGTFASWYSSTLIEKYVADIQKKNKLKKKKHGKTLDGSYTMYQMIFLLESRKKSRPLSSRWQQWRHKKFRFVQRPAENRVCNVLLLLHTREKLLLMHIKQGLKFCSKMNSIYQIRSKMLHSTKVIIFMLWDLKKYWCIMKDPWCNG